MGERKVLNKYYPPDFDPAKIPRRGVPKNQQMKIRMMLPMSVRCNTCGTYISKGTKFNSRKEDVIGEKYLEKIQIFRFYFKCTKCSAEFTIKTDPQNSDYVVESGAARNFEPWRDEDEAAEKEKRKRDAEEMGDAMKTLENKASGSKQDMDILAALEEMKSMKTRHETVSFELMLETLKRSNMEKEKQMAEVDETDEEIIESIVFHNSKDFVQRIHDDEDDDMEEDLYQPSSNLCKPKDHSLKGKDMAGNPTDSLTTTNMFNSSKNADGGLLLPRPKFIPKPRTAADGAKKPRTEPAESDKPKDEASKSGPAESHKPNDAAMKTEQNIGSKMNSGLQSLCQNYDSDESE